MSTHWYSTWGAQVLPSGNSVTFRFFIPFVIHPIHSTSFPLQAQCTTNHLSDGAILQHPQHGGADEVAGDLQDRLHHVSVQTGQGFQTLATWQI